MRNPAIESAIGRRKARRFILSGIVFVAAIAGGPRLSPAAEQTPANRARARLVADVAAVEPGRPFRLGVLYTIDPEWHMYWRYAGEVGLPTEIEWRLPEGFRAGELQWPNPIRIEDEALGLVSYAYDSEVLLFAEVTPPGDAAAEATLRFDADSNWLVCQVECIPESAKLSLELPVGTARASESAALFDRYAARTPRSDGAEGILQIGAAPDLASVQPGSSLDQRFVVRGVGDWRPLLEDAGRVAMLYPDEAGSIRTGIVAAARGMGGVAAGGRIAFDSIEIDWPIRAPQSAADGVAGLKPVLQAPALNVATGETRLVNVVFDRPVRIGAAQASIPAPTPEPTPIEPVRDGLTDQEGQARLSLIADVGAIEAGRPFRLGLYFEIEPEWHAYWRYDPIAYSFGHKFRWDLPEGFTIGPVQWPNPTRRDIPSLGPSYVYEEEALLFVEVTPPDDLAAGARLRFRAQAEWLTCHDTAGCIPGSATESLQLSVGDPIPSEWAETFDDHAALVPVEWPNESLGVEIAFSPERAAAAPGEKIEQTVTASAVGPWRFAIERRGERAELYPDRTLDVNTGTPSAARGSESVQIGGEAAFGFLTFDWPLEISARAAKGVNRLRPAIRLPMIHAETGERRTAHATFAREVAVVDSTGAIAATASTEPAVGGATGASDAPADDFAFALNHPADAASGGRGLLYYLLLAFLGGMILNVMPCVLPVLSIKIMGFVKQAGESRSRGAMLGGVFAGGVFVSFAALAAIVIGLQKGGEGVGWGFQLQEPRFVAIMSAVLFAFALSLLGVFSIELPGAAAQGLDRFQRREGPAGAFFGGVLATVLATPCTAPLLGPALGFAFSQPPAVVFGFFMAIAAGLATPYVALSANPALLQFIPKPGPWMETFKKFLGLVLIGFVIWLLWVLGAQTGADGVIVALAFLFAVGVACMIFGWGFDLRAGHFRRWGTAMAAIALAAGAYAAMPGAYIAGLEREKARDEVGARQVVWEPFSYARVNELAAEGRPIFVDFTADWCLTCKVNENLILSRDDVEAEFLKHDFATLKVDWTNRDPEIALLLQRFGRAGVPMYLIFPAGRPSDYRLLPETFTPGMAIEALREAGLS